MAAQTTSAQLEAIQDLLVQMREQLQLLVAALPPAQMKLRGKRVTRK